MVSRVGCIFFLKGKRKEEELIQCIKFTGVIMTFLSLPYKRACFLVMWQKSAQVIYNTVVWIKALIWIETDVLSIKDTSLKQRNVSDQWNLVVTNVSLSLFTWWSQTSRIFCTASDVLPLPSVCVGSWCVSVSSACLWLGETQHKPTNTRNTEHQTWRQVTDLAVKSNLQRGISQFVCSLFLDVVLISFLRMGTEPLCITKLFFSLVRKWIEYIRLLLL